MAVEQVLKHLSERASEEIYAPQETGCNYWGTLLFQTNKVLSQFRLSYEPNQMLEVLKMMIKGTRIKNEHILFIPQGVDSFDFQRFGECIAEITMGTDSPNIYMVRVVKHNTILKLLYAKIS